MAVSMTNEPKGRQRISWNGQPAHLHAANGLYYDAQMNYTIRNPTSSSQLYLLAMIMTDIYVHKYVQYVPDCKRCSVTVAQAACAACYGVD